MKVLLDTHAFLWLTATPHKLAAALPVLQDHTTELVLSAVSSWEIATKYALGKLELPETPRDFVPSRTRDLGCTLISIEHAHALRVAELPPIHGDPFDRLLIAQAQLMDVPIVTADPVFAHYGVTVLAA